MRSTIYRLLGRTVSPDSRLEADRVQASVDGNAVVAEGLSKSYGKNAAVDSLDLTVPYGAIYGCLGPPTQCLTSANCEKRAGSIFHPLYFRRTLRDV